MKTVRYNGGTDSYSSSSDPSVLNTGQEYEVIRIVRYYCQTNYVLNGIPGEFNSCWFDDVSSDGMFFMAIAKTAPVIGETYPVKIINSINYDTKEVSFREGHTSIVINSEYKGNNIFFVTTLNSTYLVQVG